MSWAEMEFRNLELGDKRIKKRRAGSGLANKHSVC